MAAPVLDIPDLTLPAGEPRTLRRLLGQYVQSVAQDFLRLPPAVVAPGNRALYQEVVRLAQAVGQREPRRLLAVFREPTVSTLVQTMRGQAVAGGDHAALNRWLREACLLVLLELARGGLLPDAGLLVGRDAEGRLPVLRSPAALLELTCGPAVTGIRFRPGELRLQSAQGETGVPLGEPAFALPDDAPARLRRPYHPIVPGVLLALTDNNPLSDFEAHPDKHGNTLDLGGQPVDAWLDSLRAAFALIDAHLPHLAEELRHTVRLMVPVGYDAEKHLSASYQEAIGVVYLTLHPQPMTMTEAVIHEFQHNKLNAAFRFDPMLHNAFSPLYASPVRPDPRPLHGVVLAVHAFQPVAKLYEAMAAAGHDMARNPAWMARFRQIVQLNREGAETVLNHARPTATGQALFAEMRALDEHFRAHAAARFA